ncbi:MAG TPA: FAD/NAD(P)-binding oxidoreductase [Candidatus Limnocylindria bacterium]|nr:FAD/NAD(P)-binding oxidoreductase [Candidatus Limnocylindria bacterium]
MGAGTVIVGTGQAGFQTGASLRSEGYEEPITLIGEEPHIPYQRPPLSKGFPLGQQNFEGIQLRPEGFYQDHRIDLLTGKRVAAVDRAARQVRLESGARIPYEKLVLAAGARNRKLMIKGAELDGVHYLRSLEEAIAVKESLQRAREIVVIGGGFIGLEIAAVARTLGKSVTVLEALPRLMSRAVAPIISEFFRELHASRGVRIICDASVSEISGSRGRVQKVVLRDGTAYSADLVMVGVGIVPNIELAQDAGLSISNGVAVNECLETDDENIFAIGDCAEHPCVFAGGRVRLESVQNAADQAQRVATTIAGRRSSYRALPWFWTDQFDIKLQMAGISHGHDRIVTRGSAESRKLSVFYFKQDRLVAVDSINRPLDHMIGRKLIAGGVALTPEQAADDSVDLRTLEHAMAHQRNEPTSH